MDNIFKCKYCGKTYNTLHGNSFHENRCIKNPDSEQYKKLTKERVCENCGKVYTLKSLLGSTEKFCSRSCANTRVITQESKDKISKTLKEYYDLHPEKTPIRNSIQKFCIVCNKPLEKRNQSGYCKEHIHLREISEETRKKLSEAGKHSAQIQKEARRSKIEALFFDKIKDIFKDAEANKVIKDGWDTDIFIPSLNLAIFWNGACHYYPIYGEKSLNATQNRDKIKKELFENIGIKVYLIKDIDLEYPKEIKKYKEKRVEFQLQKFLEFLNNKPF